MPSTDFMARYNAAVPEEGTPRQRSSRRMSFLESAAWGVADSIPWYDEIGARIDSFFMGMDYNQRVEEYRADKLAAQEDHSVAFLGGQLAGGFIPGLGAVGKGVKGAVAAGALYGAAYGSGEADDGGLENRLIGGLLGAGAGATGGYLVEAVVMPAAKWGSKKVAGYIRRGKDPIIKAADLPAAELVDDTLTAPKAPKAKPAKAGTIDPNTSLGPKATAEAKPVISDTLEDGALLTVKDLLGEPEAAAKAVAKRLGKMSPDEAEDMLKTLQKAETDGNVISNPHFRSLLKIDLDGTGVKTEQVVRAAEIFEDAIEALAEKAGQRARTVKGMDQQVRERLRKGLTLSELEDYYNQSQDGFVQTRIAQHVMLTAAAKVVRLREELLPELLKGTEGVKEKLAEELTDAAHRMVYAKGIMSNAGRALGILSHGVKAFKVDVADDAYKLGADEIRARVDASVAKLGDQNLKELLARVRTLGDAESIERILMDEAEAEAYTAWRRTVGSVSLWLRSNALTPATFLFNFGANAIHSALRGPWAKELAARRLAAAGRNDEALMLRIENDLHRSVRWTAYKVGAKAALDRIKWEFWSDVEHIAAVGYGKGSVAAKARLKRGTMLSEGYSPPTMREFDEKPRLNIRDADAFNARNEARLQSGGALANIVYHLEKARAVTANTLDALGGAGMKLFTAVPDDMGREFTRIAEGMALSTREAFREAKAMGVPDAELESYVKNRARELAEMPTATMMEKIEASLVAKGDLEGEAAFLVGLHKEIEKEADARLFMDGPQTKLGKTTANFASAIDRIGLVLPYVRTPIRLVERGLVNYGPLHAFSNEVRSILEKGGIEAELEKARIEIGMHIFNAGIVAGILGAITATNGSYNNSANLDAGPPNRLNFLGGGFLELERLAPFSMTVGLGAIVGQAIKDGYADGTEYDQLQALQTVALTAYHGLRDVVLDQTTLKGLQDLLSVDANDPDQASSRLQKILENAVSRAVPLGGVGRQFNDTFRTTAIESVGFTDALLRSIPGAGYGMAPKVDALGDEVKSRNLGINFGNSELTEGEPISPVKRKLRELGIDITTIRKSDPDGFNLTSDELSEVRRIRGKEALNSNGQTMSEALEELFSDPWFNALPTKDQKREQVVETMREFNKPAWDILMERNAKFASKKTYTKSLADYMAEGSSRSQADTFARQDLDLEGLPQPDL